MPLDLYSPVVRVHLRCHIYAHSGIAKTVWQWKAAFCYEKLVTSHNCLGGRAEMLDARACISFYCLFQPADHISWVCLCSWSVARDYIGSPLGWQSSSGRRLSSGSPPFAALLWQYKSQCAGGSVKVAPGDSMGQIVSISQQQHAQYVCASVGRWK